MTKAKVYSYLLQVSYDGTNYYGWQIQNNSSHKTIQSEIEYSLKNINKEGFIKSLGASRTDKGVHALSQFCRVDLNYDISCQGLKKSLNNKLNKDIRILSVSRTDVSFHPIRDVEEKTYEYVLKLNPSPSLEFDRFSIYLREGFNIDLMRKACGEFVGVHNFQNYFCTGSVIVSTVREILDCRIDFKEVQGLYENQKFLVFQIRGKGFLKQMVRLIVGAVIECGYGRISLDAIQTSLKVKSSLKLSPVMPAKGLILKSAKLKV